MITGGGAWVQDDDAVREANELRKHYSLDYRRAKPNRFADRFSEEAIGVVASEWQPTDPDDLTAGETVIGSVRFDKGVSCDRVQVRATGFGQSRAPATPSRPACTLPQVLADLLQEGE